MLKIKIPATEVFDEATNEIVSIKEQVLTLEHSLISISKWESKWHKPFISKDNKSLEETRDYVRCMTLNSDVDPKIFEIFPLTALKQVSEYIDDPMTATWFSDNNVGRQNREIVTSELIYYWMTALNIPFECQKWHLNRLLTLIKVCNAKNDTGKKMPKRELMSRNRALNAARRKKFNTRG